MFLFIFILVFSLFFSLLLYMMSFFLSSKVKFNNKLTAFECGFISTGSLYCSFSVHFYMILLVFVIFELEAVLLLGCIFSFGIWGFFAFFIFILLGLYLEWYLGKLSWLV